MNQNEKTFEGDEEVILRIVSDSKTQRVSLELVRPEGWSDEDRDKPATMGEIVAVAISRLWQLGTLPSLVGTLCRDLIDANAEIALVAEAQEKRLSEAHRDAKEELARARASEQRSTDHEKDSSPTITWSDKNMRHETDVDVD